MNTTRGDLSFVINGVNLAAAFEGIPLDEPLVPCVLLEHGGDSVELDTSEVKENVSTSVQIPSNITARSDTWDSITLTWNDVKKASFYQIEMDEVLSSSIITENEFTKNELLPDTVHNFRIRTVKNNTVSEWSDVVLGRVMKMSEFSECIWKECPYNIQDNRKYSIDVNNPRVTKKVKYGDFCTVIGNTPIPSSTVTSWGIKIVKSYYNNSSGIYIGVAPYDINQNESENYKKCGWYLDCYDSTLWSGPPQNCERKEYGPRKKEGKYVKTGDSVGIMMDTTKGELSFVLNGKNIGVAYERIPLDKPLVPCVIIKNNGDSVKLCVSDGDDESCIIS